MFAYRSEVRCRRGQIWKRRGPALAPVGRCGTGRKRNERRQSGYRLTMRSMWNGAISFGLVMIPVKLYAATEQRDVAFRQVHRTDGGRISFRRICSVDGAEVPFEQVAKGYELPDGEVVLVTDEDLADLPLPTTHSIEVLNFVPADQLDPILCARSYYLEPEPSGARAYVLLRDALARSGKVALARVALRQRESLATPRGRAGGLMLETLLWAADGRARRPGSAGQGDRRPGPRRAQAPGPAPGKCLIISATDPASTLSHGSPRGPTGRHGVPRIATGSHGSPRAPHGSPRAPHGSPREGS